MRDHHSHKEEKTVSLINFKLHRNVVTVLDALVETGLYKTRVDVVLSALRLYEPFHEMWIKKNDGKLGE
jgi:Arc/MetJ-type ribon-helix-helix transcriptional regulator